MIHASVLKMQTAVPEITRAYAPAGQVLLEIPMEWHVCQVRANAQLFYQDVFNNFNFLVPEPQIDEGCKQDGDCPSKEACLAAECKNPCTALTPCAENADCKVYDTLPRRTMTCTCRQGFTGKGDVRCDKISKRK